MNGTLTLEYSGRGYTANTHSRGLFFGRLASVSVTINTDDGREYVDYWIGRESERNSRESGLLHEGLRQLGILSTLKD